MATIRDRKPGVWEVRAFTGNSPLGVPTQVSRTVRGTKKDALRVAAELTVAPAGRAAGRSVSDVLEAWVRKQPPNPDRIGYWWRIVREKAGIDAKWRLHDLRHWSASVAIAAGHDVKAVADRLGHANAAMTMRVYAHAFAASDRAVADSVGAALEGDA